MLNEVLGEDEVLTLAEATALYTNAFPPAVNRWLNSAPIDAGSLYNIEHEQLTLAEAPVLTSHAKNNYLWDAADAKWDFATWG